MAEKISWNYVAKALNGPILSGQGELVPSGTVSLLVINPAVPDVDLSYDVGGNAVALDGPHVLFGTGAVSLLGGVTNLSFTNNTGADATIEILLGRDATP